MKFIFILGILLFCGCRGGEVTGSPVSGKATETKALPAAPDFEVSALDGKVIKLSALKGKVVVIDFWATWCGPCVYEIPGFINLYNKYNKKGLEIIGFSVDRDRQAVFDFVKNKGVNYPIAFADDELQEKFGGIQGLPTTFFVDKAGRIAGRVVGARDEAFFEKEIIKLLGGGNNG